MQAPPVPTSLHQSLSADQEAPGVQQGLSQPPCSLGFLENPNEAYLNICYSEVAAVRRLE